MRYAVVAFLCLASALVGAVGAAALLRPAAPAAVDLTTEIHRLCAERHAPIEAAIADCRASFALGARADAMRRQAVEAYKARAGL